MNFLMEVLALSLSMVGLTAVMVFNPVSSTGSALKIFRLVKLAR